MSSDSSDPRDRLLDAALQLWSDHGWIDADTDVDRELMLEQGSMLFELVMAGD